MERCAAAAFLCIDALVEQCNMFICPKAAGFRRALFLLGYLRGLEGF